jgi:photosystem II stability/assembly factor-like uncharacterized protein
MINCLEIKLKTHDSYLSDQVIDCDEDNVLYTKGAIGDYKSLEYSLEYLPDVSDSASDMSLSCSGSTIDLPDKLDIWFNAWMYGVASDWVKYFSPGNEEILEPPAEGWYIRFDINAMIVGTPYLMTVNGCGVNANSQKNISVYFTAMGCNQFKITAYFYLISDIDSPIWNDLLDNRTKLLKSHRQSSQELDNTAQSVYNVDKEINSIVYIKDNIDIQEHYWTHKIPVTWKFYDKDSYDSVSPITTTFTYTRGGIVDNFSAFGKTLVTVEMTSFDKLINAMTVELINVSNNDNEKTFIDNYDFSFANIITDGTTAQIDNHIWSPSVLTPAVGSTIGSFYINTDLDCISTYRLIAIGYSKVNGGYDYIPQDSTITTDIQELCFIDENVGWGCGSGGKVIKTTNGGDTWQQMTSGTTNDLTSIFFINSSVGWFCGANILKKSTDGGVTWVSQTSGFPAFSYIYSIRFLNTTTGFACGDNGRMSKTTDGGTTWVNTQIVIAPTLYSIFIIDANNIWVCGDGGVILYSSDTGGSWGSEISTVITALQDIFFLDANNGWACGGAGKVIKTTNGGATWSTVHTHSPATSFYSIKMQSTTIGYVATSQNILKTTDGGTTWGITKSGYQLFSIFIVDSTHIWFGGYGGAIFKYGLTPSLDDVWSSISDEIEIDCIPDCNCKLTEVHSWGDYKTDDFNNDSIITTTHDRVKAFGSILLSDLLTCVNSWCSVLGITSYPTGYLDGVLYRVSKLKVVIREVFEDYPQDGKVTYAIYDSINATRDKITGVWNIPDSRLSISESTSLEYAFEFRTRYEDNINPLDILEASLTDPENTNSVGSLISNYATALGVNNDWEDRHLQVVWYITLEFNDAPQPFEFTYFYKERLYIHEDDNTYSYPYMESIKLFDESMNEITNGVVCNSNKFIYVRIKALTSCDESSCSVSGSDSCCTDCQKRNVIALLDRYLYSINSLKENESWTGQLQQLTDSEMYDVDSKFDTDCYAWFKIDLSKIDEGSTYQICIITK